MTPAETSALTKLEMAMEAVRIAGVPDVAVRLSSYPLENGCGLIVVTSRTLDADERRRLALAWAKTFS